MTERTEGKPIPSPDDTLTVALSLAKAGWPVFPVALVPVTRADGSQGVDKRPLVRWLDGATTDLEQIATWWGGEFAHAWVGVHAARAGIVVVDLDLDKVNDKGEHSGTGRDNLRHAGIDLPKTFRYRTRSGGTHHVYRAPKDRVLTIARDHPVKAVDIRAGHGLMVYYGPVLTGKPDLAKAPDWALVDGTVSTREADGDVDAWLARAAPGKPKGALRKLAKATDWSTLTHEPMLEVVSELIKRGTEPGAAAVFQRGRLAYVTGRPDRERDWDNAAAGSIGRHGLPPVTLEITKTERKAIAKRNDPAAVEQRAQARKDEYRIRIHAERSRTPGSRVLEDGPLSEEFAEVTEGRWAWTKGRGLMRYTGKVWTAAAPHALIEEVRAWLDTVEIEEHQAAVLRGDNRGIDKARTLLSRGRARAVADFVVGLVAKTEVAFDAHPDLLNTPNGVVDLRTTTLLPHDPALYLTRMTSVAYDPDADMTMWLKALTALPPKVADWLRVRFGQAATGYTPDDDRLLLFQASGENGKTTVFAAIREVLGDSLQGGYAVTVPDRLLTADPGDHPTTLMMLMGARLAVFEELPEGRNLNVKRLKDTVGTTSITARLMRQDDVTFKATHALMGDTNYQAIVAETDHGTWRRLALVRFPYRFVKSAAEIESEYDRVGDVSIRRYFEGHADPGVLRWLVEGARQWYDDGMRLSELPKRVVRDTEAWRLDADPVLGYLTERIERDDERAIPSDDLVRDFNDHLERRGHRPWSAQTVNSRFEGHVGMAGVKRRPVRFGARLLPSRPPLSVAKPLAAGVRAWVGIRFKSEAEPTIPMSPEVAAMEERLRGES